MRIRWKAVAPLLGVIGAYLASPAALAIVPAQYAWILALVAGIITALTPALVTNRPKSAPAHRLNKRLEKAGLAEDSIVDDVEIPPPAPLGQFRPPEGP